MGSIVIAMPGYEDSVRLKEIIRRSGLGYELHISRKGSEILNLAEGMEISLVICTVKLSDMGYEELSNYLPTDVRILLLTRNEALVPFSSHVTRLLMPFKTEDLITGIRKLCPIRSPGSRKKPPGRSPAEQRLIDEAKHTLMTARDMTEPEAFRYLQKTSMDTGRSMVESAQMILLLNGK